MAAVRRGERARRAIGAFRREAVLGRAKRAARKAHPGTFGVIVTPAAAAAISAGLKPWVEPEEGACGRA